MKTKQLIEIENVKGANRVLKNLLERTRTEIVGIGLFYGKPGLGKTRWMTKTAMENGFIYLRLEVNITTKDFLRELLTRLLHKTMPYYQVKGTQNEIYNQILDILQRDQNITILIDEIDYAFNNDKILESIRDMADQSLATFVLAGMESSREGLLKHSPHFFSRTCATHLFRELSFEDTEMVVREICEVKICSGIIKFIYTKSNGSMRIINKYIDAIEKIARKMKRSELTFSEIKDIISKLEA